MHSIQSLVGSIRADENPTTVKEHLRDIAAFVSKIVSETRHTTDSSHNSTLRNEAEPVVKTLSGCRAKLMEASAEGEGITAVHAWKEFTKKLPPLAFEVARETKELVQRLDQLDESQDDFR